MVYDTVLVVLIRRYQANTEVILYRGIRYCACGAYRNTVSINIGSAGRRLILLSIGIGILVRWIKMAAQGEVRS